MSLVDGSLGHGSRKPGKDTVDLGPLPEEHPAESGEQPAGQSAGLLLDKPSRQHSG